MTTTTTLPWFRFYSEALNDRKIMRACILTKQPKATVLGVWVTLLSIANDSPERGRLLISEDMPITLDEILMECGLDDPCIVNALEDLGMVHWEGETLVISQWENRQFDSDNSTERVRRWREKQRQEKAENNQDGEEITEIDEENDENEPETPKKVKRFNGNDVKRFRNVIDTDKETDKDIINPIINNAREKIENPPKPHPPPEIQLANFYQQQTGNAPRGITDDQIWQDDCLDILKRTGGDIEKAKLLMSEAIIILDGAHYTHKKPGSLINTIDNQLKDKRKGHKNGSNKSSVSKAGEPNTSKQRLLADLAKLGIKPP